MLKRMLGEYVSSALDAGIFNEIMTIFTYNVVEAHRGGTSWTKGHMP
ncbi:MAG: hypothetical protein QXY52_05000 [Conexivisphaerales archaeon]